MPVALIMAVVGALVAWLAFAAWQGRLVARALQTRTCPSCRAALTPMTAGPGSEAGDPHPRSYEVMACPECETVVTSVHGARSEFAYCPSCRQLSLRLRTSARGSASQGAVPGVDVDENCQICGFSGTLHIPGNVADDAPDRDNVIPFRRG